MALISWFLRIDDDAYLLSSRKRFEIVRQDLWTDWTTSRTRYVCGEMCFGRRFWASPQPSFNDLRMMMSASAHRGVLGFYLGKHTEYDRYARKHEMGCACMRYTSWGTCNRLRPEVTKKSEDVESLLLTQTLHCCLQFRYHGFYANWSYIHRQIVTSLRIYSRLPLCSTIGMVPSIWCCFSVFECLGCRCWRESEDPQCRCIADWTVRAIDAAEEEEEDRWYRGFKSNGKNRKRSSN